MMDTRSNLSRTKRHGSPNQLSANELTMLQEPDFYRKKGDRIDDALYRDHLKRMARHKLMQETNAITQKQQSQGVKLTIKTQQLAIQKLEKDLDALIKIFSHENPQNRSERFVSRDELIQMFRVIECFRELDTVENPNKDASFLVGKNSFIGNNHSRELSRSISPHIKKDSFRMGQRLKQEEDFLNHLWNYFLSPSDHNEAQSDILNETFKIVFNHYIPNTKQIELLMDLQKLVNSIDFGHHKQLLTEEKIDEKIIKRFQQLYPHYYNLNNISKISNSEKRINNVKDHFKEFTFKPKINPESANLDYQNLTQIYQKLQHESSKNNDKSVQLNQTLQKEGQPDIEVVEPDDSDNDNNSQDDANNTSHFNLNENNLHKFNSMLSKYLQEYKMSEISQPDSSRNNHKHTTQNSVYTQNESVKTVLIHQIKDSNGDKASKSRTPKGRSQVSKQPTQRDNKMDTSASKSKTPDKQKVFRFEYWYLQEKLKQEKIKNQIEEKMKNDSKDCTFKPNINRSQNTSAISHSKSPYGAIPRGNTKGNITPTNLNRDKYPIGKPPTTPQQVSGNKFEALYVNEKEKKKMREEFAKLKKEEREIKQLQECTFKPRLISKSPVNNGKDVSASKKPGHSKSPTPQGYEDTINRMRMAQKEKERQKQLLENLGKVRRENIDRSITPTKQAPFNLSYQQKLDNKKYMKEKDDDVLLYMEILVKQGQKVKLKVKRDDSPKTVAKNFAKIYGLNQKSEDALGNIILDQIKRDRLQISSIKTSSQLSKEVPTTIKEGYSMVEGDDSFDSKSFQQLNNLSAIKNNNQNLEQSLGMIDEKQENEFQDEEDYQSERNNRNFRSQGGISQSQTQSQIIANQTNQYEYDNIHGAFSSNNTHNNNTINQNIKFGNEIFKSHDQEDDDEIDQGEVSDEGSDLDLSNASKQLITL